MAKLRKLSTSINKKMKTVGSNMGYGRQGPWPEEQAGSAEHVCTVTGMTIKEDETFNTHGKNHPRNKALDSFSVQFHYNYTQSDGTTLKFDGQRRVIPYDFGKVPADEDKKMQNAKSPTTRAEIGLSEVKGCLHGMLGSEPENIGNALTKIEKMLAAAAEDSIDIEANVFCEINSRFVPDAGGGTPKKYTDKNDYIRSLTSSPTDEEEDEEVLEDEEEEEYDDEDLEDEEVAEDDDEEEAEEEPAPPPKKKKRKTKRG